MYKYFTLMIGILAAFEAQASENYEGKTLYSKCAACHLPDGKGVAGVFPPLDQHIGKLSSTAAGRKYLISVLSYGLTGALNVNGKNYSGFMPAQNLNDAQVASVLNYVLKDISKAPKALVKFTQEEVAAVRKVDKKPTAQDVRKLRPE